MKSDVSFVVSYRASGALAGAIQRSSVRTAEDTKTSFEKLRDRIWGAAGQHPFPADSRRESEESHWQTRSKKIRERLAVEAEIYAERQRQLAINQELYARNLQQQQLNERAVLSGQGLEPGIIGLTSLVPPIMQGTVAPVLH
ncbi:MAG: hypothetical protein K5841_05440 [Fretibacterium sp.]|nr:hypothetical protein [Fretibacterium sp.]